MIIKKIAVSIIAAVVIMQFAFTEYAHASEWMSKGPEMSVGTFSVRKNGKKVDVRKQTKKIWKKMKPYNIAQSSATDGEYLYMAFEKRPKEGAKSKKVRIRIMKVRTKDWKVVKVSKPLKLGHANDMTYNPSKRKLVVTGWQHDDPYVRLVSTGSLKYAGKKRVCADGKKAFCEIDYDPESRTYVVKARGKRNTFYLLNDQFRKIRKLKSKKGFPDVDLQGSTTYKGAYIVASSRLQTKKKNGLTVYDRSTGKIRRRIRLRMSGELESVFVIGKRLFATVHKHCGHGYKTGFILRIKL